MRGFHNARVENSETSEYSQYQLLSTLTTLTVEFKDANIHQSANTHITNAVPRDYLLSCLLLADALLRLPDLKTNKKGS